jgi:TonB family protein
MPTPAGRPASGCPHFSAGIPPQPGLTTEEANMNNKLPLILFAAAAFALPATTRAEADAASQLSAGFRVDHYVEPLFPSALRNKSITEGYAQVQLLVAADGSLLEVFVSAYSRPEFAEAVEIAIKNWKFRPAENPAALPVRFSLRINFRREGMLLVQGDFVETINHFLRTKEDLMEVATCKLRDLDAIPETTNIVVPEYPAELKKQNVNGAATVSFFIDENGTVHTVSVVEASRPEFGLAAINAVKQWSFAPPMHKGSPTRVLAVQDFDFTPAKAPANGKTTR